MDLFIQSIMQVLAPIIILMVIATLILPKSFNPFRYIFSPFANDSGFWRGFWAAFWTSPVGKIVIIVVFLIGVCFFLEMYIQRWSYFSGA